MNNIAALENLFKTNTSAKKKEYSAPLQENLAEVKEFLALVEDTFYSEPVTASKRLFIGSRLRNIASAVLTELTGDEMKTLLHFHASHKPIVATLQAQRTLDQRTKSINPMMFTAVYKVASEIAGVKS